MTSDADAIQDPSSSDFIKIRLKHQFDITGDATHPLEYITRVEELQILRLSIESIQSPLKGF